MSFIITTAARIKDDETAKEIGASFVSYTGRYDGDDLDDAIKRAIQQFVDINDGIFDPASVEVYYHD